MIWNEGRKRENHNNSSAGKKWLKKKFVHLPFTEESRSGYLELLTTMYKIQ